MLDSINRALACGQVIMGYATWLCSAEQCSHFKKICMGCQSRIRDTCGKKLTDQWIEKVLSQEKKQKKRVLSLTD